MHRIARFMYNTRNGISTMNIIAGNPPHRPYNGIAENDESA
jgi:hypothetical protein